MQGILAVEPQQPEDGVKYKEGPHRFPPSLERPVLE